MLGKASCHRPRPHSFSFNYRSLPFLAWFVIDASIRMCEWLSVLSAETVEKGESGGSGVPGRPPHLPWYIPLPTPISSPAPPGHLLPLGSSPGLAPILQPSLPIFQSGGDLMPGTFYIPFRAACYSLLQLHCVHCILPSCPGLSAQPSGSTQPTPGSLLAIAAQVSETHKVGLQ